jgi:hypothetical protein
LHRHRETLAELQRRFDGAFDPRLRDEALTRAPRPLGMSFAAASRDIDRLALAAVLSLAQLRSAIGGTILPQRLVADRTAVALTDALRSYRTLGVRLVDAATKACLAPSQVAAVLPPREHSG